MSTVAERRRAKLLLREQELNNKTAHVPTPKPEEPKIVVDTPVSTPQEPI